MIKKNDVLKSKSNKVDEFNILEVVGDVYCIGSKTITGIPFVYGWLTLSELERDYVIPKEVWEPKSGEKYWIIDAEGEICDQVNYNQVFTEKQKNFLGVYETKFLAEQALAEIKRKLQ